MSIFNVGNTENKLKLSTSVLKMGLQMFQRSVSLQKHDVIACRSVGLNLKSYQWGLCIDIQQSNLGTSHSCENDCYMVSKHCFTAQKLCPSRPNPNQASFNLPGLRNLCYRHQNEETIGILTNELPCHKSIWITGERALSYTSKNLGNLSVYCNLNFHTTIRYSNVLALHNTQCAQTN